MKVVMYSTPTCGFCNMAKAFFTANDIEFEEYNVKADAEKLQEMTEKSGQRGVPVIVIDDDEVIVGFKQARLQEIINNNTKETFMSEPTLKVLDNGETDVNKMKVRIETPVTKVDTLSVEDIDRKIRSGLDQVAFHKKMTETTLKQVDAFKKLRTKVLAEASGKTAEPVEPVDAVEEK